MLKCARKSCSLSMAGRGRDCKLSCVSIWWQARQIYFKPTLEARLAILRLVLILVTVPVLR